MPAQALSLPCLPQVLSPVRSIGTVYSVPIGGGFGGLGGFGGFGGLDRPGLAGLAAQGLVAARLIRARAAARAMGSVILKIPKV